MADLVAVERTSAFRITGLRVGTWQALTACPTLDVSGDDIVVSAPQVTMRLRYTPQPGYQQQLPRGRWNSELRSLDEVPGHRDAGPGLRRYAFVDAPVHAAVHQILDGGRLVPGYCQIHTHDDAAELNVLLPGDPARPLAFDLYSGAPVPGRAPLSMWIPAGTAHSAVAIGGTGYLFVLRVPLSGQAQAA